MEDEAERLAALHPWAGTEADEAVVRWMPQHAVPKHRPIARPPADASWIDKLVEADLEAIDRELDPRARRFKHKTYAKSVVADAAHWARMAEEMRRVQELLAENHSNYFFGPSFHDLIKTSPRPPKPPKQRKAKTYDIPNRRAKRSAKVNMGWIDRAQQSKQARKHNGP